MVSSNNRFYVKMKKKGDFMSQKKEKSLKDAPMPPLPFEKEKKETKSVKEILTVTEALEKIEEMRKFSDEIKQKLDEVYRVTGWTPQFLDSYLNNPSNFSVVEWERVNKERQDLMESLKISPDSEKPVENLPPDSKKQRKKKGVATRKNWLPMR